MICIEYLHRNGTIATVLAPVVIASMLASAAKAEIVYQSANIAIGNGTYNLDVNGDGVTDFTIAETGRIGSCGIGCTYWERSLDETPASGNGAIVGPLRSGQEIGPNEVFDGNETVMSRVTVTRLCYFDRNYPRTIQSSGRAIRSVIFSRM